MPLFIALTFPVVVSHAYATDASFSASTQSIIGFQNKYPESLGEDKPDICRSTEWVAEQPQRLLLERPSGSNPEPDFAFTVSQARAPPLP